jgi:hypothetical protein
LSKAWIVSLLVVVLVPNGADLRADPPQDLAQGARIRVESAAGTSTGTLAGQDAASLTLQVKDLSDPLVVPRAHVMKLHVSEGRAKGKAALIGGAIGLGVAGALVAAGARGAGCDGGECLCSGSGCLAAVVILGIPAAAMGAGVGALVAPERWREIPMAGAAALSLPLGARSSRARLTLAPIWSGAAASLRCSF